MCERNSVSTPSCAEPEASVERPLSEAESARLAERETVIEEGFKTFIDVGNALMDIRDERLYRATHQSFEDYCRERWGMSRVHAHRMIEAAGVVGNLLPIGNILPSNEVQARPLTSLPPEQQPVAWKRAVETAPDGRVTAQHVAEVVEAEFRFDALPKAHRSALAVIEPARREAIHAEAVAAAPAGRVTGPRLQELASREVREGPEALGVVGSLLFQARDLLIRIDSSRLYPPTRLDTAVATLRQAREARARLDQVRDEVTHTERYRAVAAEVDRLEAEADSAVAAAREGLERFYAELRSREPFRRLERQFPALRDAAAALREIRTMKQPFGGVILYTYDAL